MSRPVPAWLRAIAAPFLPAEHRDLILDDLDEDFARRRRFGHAWYLAQAIHLAWTTPWRPRALTSPKGPSIMWATLWQDVRYGLRTLRRSPGFTAVAVLSLAVGIGLNSAIFTIADNLLFRPLPYERPDSVVSIYTTENADSRYGTSSYADLQDLAMTSTAFESIAGHSMMFAAVGIEGENRLAFGEVVTPNYFSSLGIPLAAGRGFDSTHEVGEGAHPVTLISHRLWQRSFGGRADALGRTLTIKNKPYTILGVVDASYTGGLPGVSSDLWIPVTMVGDVEPAGQISVVPSATGTTRLEQRGSRWLFAKGRLRDGVSLTAAQANVDAITASLERDYPKSNRERRGVVLPATSVRFHPEIDAIMRPAGLVLMGAVGLVLLIACANLASMLLARGAARTKEMALRSAIGASQFRLVRQMAAESTVLALLGGAAGLLLAVWATSWIVSARLPIGLPIAFTLAMDWRLVAYTGGLSLLTGLVFGILPALKASRPALVASLKDDATLAAPGRAFGLRHALVVVQVSISVVLVVSGVLLVRSLFAGFNTNPGFAASGLVATTVSMDMHGYDDARAKLFFEQATARLRQLPGVASVSLAERIPFSPNLHTTTILVEGRPEATPRTGASVDISRVTAEFFRTLGVPIVAGREFDNRDVPESVRAAIVSETFARTYFPNGDVLGGRLRLLSTTGPEVEIVGVSKDYMIRQVGEAPRPVIHFAASQRASNSYSILARTSSDPGALITNIQRELQGIEPQLIFLDSGSLERLMATSMLPISLGASVFGGLAGLALMLAGVGLYGVIAFSVSRRTKEIGIRMALGSSRGSVVKGVLREALILVVVGTVIGVGLAALGAQALSSVLLGVTAFDPLSYLAAGVVLLSVAALAAIIPARRAASVDPLIALRTL